MNIEAVHLRQEYVRVGFANISQIKVFTQGRYIGL